MLYRFVCVTSEKRLPGGSPEAPNCSPGKTHYYYHSLYPPTLGCPQGKLPGMDRADIFCNLPPLLQQKNVNEHLNVKLVNSLILALIIGRWLFILDKHPVTSS